MPFASPILLGLLVASALVLMATLVLVLRQERREMTAGDDARTAPTRALAEGT